MDAKEKFAKAQGGQAKGVSKGRLVLHLMSIPFTTWGFYQSYFGGTFADCNLWLLALALCVASAVRYIISSQEVSVSRQLVWWAFPNAGAILSFIMAFAFMGGLIWYDHQTSQVGRIEGIDEITGEAEQEGTQKVDSTLAVQTARYYGSFTADSLAAMATLSVAIEADRSELKEVARAEVAAMRKKARSVEARYPSWAAGIRQNAAKKEAAAISAYNTAVAKSKRLAASTIQGFRSAMRGKVDARDSIATADLIAIRAANELAKNKHDQSQQLAQNAGKWIVVITSAGSFILSLLWEGYRRISGLKMEGEKYDPSEANKSPLRHLYGFVADHVDVIDKRMDATRKDYRKASESKGAYQLPPSAKVLQFAFGLALVYGIGQTFVYTQDQYEATRASIFSLPFPYNWAFTLFAGIGLVVAIWRNKWNGKPVEQPVQIAEPEKSTEPAQVLPVEDTVEKPSETRVAQGFEEEEDGEVIDADDVVITKLKKLCDTNYYRQFTAATDNGKDSAQIKFKESRARLRGLGFVVATLPTKKKLTVRGKSGKPVSRSVPKLKIK